MKKIIRLTVTIHFLLFYMVNYGQNEKVDQIFPKYTIGVSGGYFLSQLKDIDKIYGSQFFLFYGWSGSVLIHSIGQKHFFYGTMGQNIFSKNGKTVGDIVADAKLEQKFLDFGVRYSFVSFDSKVVRMLLGVGYSIISYNEKFEVWGNKVTASNSISGYYIEFGAAARLIENSPFEFFGIAKYVYGKENKTLSGLAGDSPLVGGIFSTIGISLSIY